MYIEVSSINCSPCGVAISPWRAYLIGYSGGFMAELSKLDLNGTSHQLGSSITLQRVDNNFLISDGTSVGVIPIHSGTLYKRGRALTLNDLYLYDGTGIVGIRDVMVSSPVPLIDSKVTVGWDVYEESGHIEHHSVSWNSAEGPSASDISSGVLVVRISDPYAQYPQIESFSGYVAEPI